MPFLSKPDRQVSAKARRRKVQSVGSPASPRRKRERPARSENERMAFGCEVASQMVSNPALQATLLEAAEKLRSLGE